MAQSSKIKNPPRGAESSEWKASKENRSKTKKRGSKGSRPTILRKAKEFFQDTRTRKVFGAFMLLLALYLFVAFTSFVFTWKQDQAHVANKDFIEVIGNKDFDARNRLGRFGAYIAHQFMHNWFGIAAYFFVFLSFMAGIRTLFGVRVSSAGRTIAHVLFGLIWIPVTLAFFFREKWLFLGGYFGHYLREWLEGILGTIGTGAILFFSLLAFIIIIFDPNLGHWQDRIATLFNRFLASTKGDNYPSDQDEDEDMALSPSEGSEGEGDNGSGPEPAYQGPDHESNEEGTIPMETSISPTTEGDPEELSETPPETEEMPNKGTNKEEEGPENTDPESAPDETDEPTELSLDRENSEDEEKTGNEEGFSVSVAQAETEESTPDEKGSEGFGEYDPTLDLSEYRPPHLELLDDHGSNEIHVDREEQEANKNKIVRTLENYNIPISKIHATVGPTLTLYEIVPGAGVRISKIRNLEDDIALSLAALGIRIIAPIPGRGTIGIEVPNAKPQTVSMRSILASDKFQRSEMELPMALGKTINNEAYLTDLTQMPHLLMAGATGQGKSVGLNAILASLLYKKHPAQVKFVLVDPKRVELTLFKKIERHFLAKLPDAEEAIVTSNDRVISTLNSLTKEMDERYKLLQEAEVKSIKEYNKKFIERRLNPEKGHRFLPYMVLVVDEFADLIMTAGKEIETPIARLAQLARAIGIHLIIATQRPSVNVITGMIKANFPARVAFRVTQKTDSRTILDASGAEQLIGKGDMLLSTGSELQRLQCAFIDTHEIERITEFIGEQRGYPEAFQLPEPEQESSGDTGNSGQEERDPMFEDAARLLVQHQQGSTSLIQRKLRLGYNRAGRIVDQLESAGVIGPFEGSKARRVLIPDEYTLEQFLNDSSEENDQN